MALFTRPREQELTALGLLPEDVADQFYIEVMPDNVEAFSLFADCATQWRMGPVGPIGIDYISLEAVMRMRRVPRAERDELFSDIRVMEAAALESIWSRQ